MNKQKLLFFFTLVLIFVLGIISLPNFNFKIAGKNINYEGVDLKTFEIDSDLGNMKKGSGLFATQETKTIINFPSEDGLTDTQREDYLEKALEIVQGRLNVAKLYDITVKGEAVNGTYSIVLSFPGHYSNPTLLTKWLATRGEISFAAVPTTGAAAVLVHDYDVEGSVVAESEIFTSTGGNETVNFLEFKFREESLTDLENSFPAPETAGSNQSFILMNVDNVITYYVARKVDRQKSSQTNTVVYKDTYVNAIPVSVDSFGNELTAAQESILLDVTKAYFSEKSALDYEVTFSENIGIVSPDFAPDGASVVAISLVVSVFILIVLLINRASLKGAISLGLMLSAWTFLTIFILKISAATLSIETVLGYLIYLLLFTLFSIEILRQDDATAVKELIRSQRKISFVLIFLIIIIYRLLLVLGIFSDIFGVFLVCSLASLAISFIGVPQIVSFKNNEFRIFPKFKFNIKLKKNG